MVSRFIAGLACLAFFLGTGMAQEKDESPDDQVKKLIARYLALPEKDQIGPGGANIVKQLKAMAGKVGPRSQEAIARLETAYNLRQIALAIQQPKGKDANPPPIDSKGLFQLLPYIEQGSARPRWEYKVMAETDLLKLGKDNLTAGLNKLGEDGWELVGFEKTRFILKRPNTVSVPAN